MAAPTRDILLALKGLRYAQSSGRAVDIGPPASPADLEEVRTQLPELPADVIEWYQHCSFVQYAWGGLFGPRCPTNGCTVFDCLRQFADRTWRPVGKDLFGCTYCIDTSQHPEARPVFLVEFGTSDLINYHVASSFPKFLRLIAHAVITDNPDWEADRDLICSIDPDLENMPDVLLPWVVLDGDGELPDWARDD